MNATNVLLIDDDAKLLKSLSRDLTEVGYDVTTTISAIEAAAALSQKEFDVVVCDHNMHGESGVSFLSSLKHKYPDIAKILLSGGIERQKREEVELRDVCHFVLCKPSAVTEIDACIQDAIKMVQAQVSSTPSPNLVSSTVEKIGAFLRPRSMG